LISLRRSKDDMMKKMVELRNRRRARTLGVDVEQYGVVEVIDMNLTAISKRVRTKLQMLCLKFVLRSISV